MTKRSIISTNCPCHPPLHVWLFLEAFVIWKEAMQWSSVRDLHFGIMSSSPSFLTKLVGFPFFWGRVILYCAYESYFLTHLFFNTQVLTKLGHCGPIYRNKESILLLRSKFLWWCSWTTWWFHLEYFLEPLSCFQWFSSFNLSVVFRGSKFITTSLTFYSIFYLKWSLFL